MALVGSPAELAPVPLVSTAVLLAAMLHASWNALAKKMGNQRTAFWLINLTAAVLGALLLLTTPFPARASWIFIVISVCIHVAYNIALLNSYRLGDFGQVYPLARGIAPLLVTALAAIASSETPTPVQMIGIVIIAFGLATLVLRSDGLSDRRSVELALGTGLTIAAYSVIDGLGARHSGSPMGYAGMLFLGEGLLVAMGIGYFCREELQGQVMRIWKQGIVAGTISVVAYVIVLWAQTQTRLALVSALRETSVIIAAFLATAFLGEDFGRQRVLAAGIVTIGVLFIFIG